jgi:hypothetical protein
MTRPELLIAGGTVSDVSISTDGTNYTATGITSGAIVLEPGEYLKVSYSSVPTMTRQRLL